MSATYTLHDQFYRALRNLPVEFPRPEIVRSRNTTRSSVCSVSALKCRLRTQPMDVQVFFTETAGVLRARARIIVARYRSGGEAQPSSTGAFSVQHAQLAERVCLWFSVIRLHQTPEKMDGIRVAIWDGCLEVVPYRDVVYSHQSLPRLGHHKLTYQ